MDNKNKVKSLNEISDIFTKQLNIQMERNKYVRFIWKNIVDKDIYENSEIIIEDNKILVNVFSFELRTLLLLRRRELMKKFKESGIVENLIIKYKGGQLGK